jgi:hypothetical protein
VTGPQPNEDQRRNNKRRQSDERHQHLERVPVGVVGQQRGRDQNRERARRILDEDVAVGNPPVDQALRVLAVKTDVAVLAPAEEPSLRDRRRQDVEGRDGSRRPHGGSQIRRATRR